MSLSEINRSLREHRENLEIAINAIERVLGAGQSTSTEAAEQVRSAPRKAAAVKQVEAGRRSTPAPKRKAWSPEARRAAAERLRKRWAERKANGNEPMKRVLKPGVSGADGAVRPRFKVG